MGKKQTNIEKKNYYIPLEITPETIITEEYRNSEVHWSKIGCRKVRTILIPATKEEELLAALRHELAALQDIDRTILMMLADGSSEAATGKAVGLSQKAVNKRKHKLYALLKEHLEDFR